VLTANRPAARSRQRRLLGLGLLNLLGIGVVLVLLGILPPPPPRTAAPLELVAHRGDIAHFPANTLEGIASAVRLGADAVEFDTWPSADGTWWLMHDLDVSVTTNGKGSLTDLSDDELSELRIDGGPGYVAERDDQRFSVPRLEEALSEIATSDVGVYLHCKPSDAASATDLAELLVNYDLASRAVLIIPTVEQAEAVKTVDATITALVIHEYFDPPIATPDVDGWLTDAAHILSRDFVEERPYDVYAYANLRVPPDDELGLLERAYRRNVKAFITNDLEAAQAKLRQLAGSE
jgi:glycerophosphoryl diester phosphodiesterase